MVEWRDGWNRYMCYTWQAAAAPMYSWESITVGKQGTEGKYNQQGRQAIKLNGYFANIKSIAIFTQNHDDVPHENPRNHTTSEYIPSFICWNAFF